MRRPKYDSGYVEIADAILKESREELTRADGKSALLLAAASVAVGAVSSAVIASDWQPMSMTLCAQLIWWLGVSAGAGGIVALAFAVYPRTKYRARRSPAVIAFFGDVVSTPASELRAKLDSTAASESERLIDQLTAVASIVDRKYRGIQIGLWLFGLCVCLLVVSRLVDMLFH